MRREEKSLDLKDDAADAFHEDLVKLMKKHGIDWNGGGVIIDSTWGGEAHAYTRWTLRSDKVELPDFWPEGLWYVAAVIRGIKQRFDRVQEPVTAEEREQVLRTLGLDDPGFYDS